MAEERKRTSRRIARTAGTPEKQSRQKAEAAKDRSNEVNKTGDPTEQTAVPLTADGRPMVRILATSAELIPTGQFANVSVGPAQIIAYIDPRNPKPFTDEELENIAKAVNVLSELVEVDVVGVQRTLVLENLQENVSGS